nr:xylanase [Cellvibrio gilvus, Peptide Partial, 10 aa] [Cellulomonas gilvus]
ATTLKEAADG